MAGKITKKNQKPIDKRLEEALWIEFGSIIERRSYPEGKEIYSKMETEKFISEFKKMFFYKFGDLLTEEELDKRIKENVIGIYKAPKINSDEADFKILGIYDIERKEVVLSKEDSQTIFHELTHAIVDDEGAQIYMESPDDNNKEIRIGEGINEGFVSYIQIMPKIKKWFKYCEVKTNDEERRIVGQLYILHDNILQKNQSDLIESYITEAPKTISKIEDVFANFYKNALPNANDEEIKKLAYKKCFDFMILVDKFSDAPRELTKCEDILSEVYEKQILNKQINTQEELNAILYQIQGYFENLYKPNIEIYKLIYKKVEEFLKNNPEKDIKDILDGFPKMYDGDSVDIRYEGIIRALNIIKDVHENEKKVENQGR